MLNPDGMMGLVVTQIYIGHIYIYILGRTPILDSPARQSHDIERGL